MLKNKSTAEKYIELLFGILAQYRRETFPNIRWRKMFSLQSGSSVGCENSDGDSKADSTTREGAEGDQRGAARDPKMVWTEIGNW